MGNSAASRMKTARERSRELLAAQAVEFERRQRSVGEAVAQVWAALDARDSRAAKRDAEIEKARIAMNAAVAKATASYDADPAVTGLQAISAVAIERLLDEHKSVAQIADLTGLNPADIRTVKAKRTRAAAPASALSASDAA